MEELNQSDIERLLEFINQNELDFIPVDNGITKFHINSFDKMKFFIHPYNEQYVIIKYDPSKDIEGVMGSKAYEYYYFQNLQQVLEQLSLYDNSLHKSYWQPTMDSIEVGFDSNSYVDDWYNEFKGDSECWGVEDCDQYKYLTYNDDSYSPKLKSPWNSLHEVSPINDEELIEVGKLNFEIHPISCAPGQESYYFKLCSNNEEVLKEYINYLISSKKGLKLFLETIFKEMEQFKNYLLKIIIFGLF